MNNLKLSTPQIERMMDDVIKTLQQIAPDKILLRGFLNDLLTPSEYRDVALRWRIVNMIAEGQSQRDIADALGVSPSKITRGSRELLDPKGAFAQLLHNK